jgi:hypothetical protein
VTQSFKVGDKLVAGPFKSGYHGENIWVVEKPDGTHMTPTENSLTKVSPVADEIRVGDRVRILHATYAGRTHGMTGTVTSSAEVFRQDVRDHHPYCVRLDAGGSVYVRDLEKIDDPSTTYTHAGVTYDLTARYRDRDGDTFELSTEQRSTDATEDGNADGTPLGRYSDSRYWAWSLAEVARCYGPLTRIDD